MFDLWDLGAVLALGSILTGLSAWYWPAALVAGGVMFLWVYYHREKALAAQSTARR